jgi:hypothetical protein
MARSRWGRGHVRVAVGAAAALAIGAATAGSATAATGPSWKIIKPLANGGQVTAVTTINPFDGWAFEETNLNAPPSGLRVLRVQLGQDPVNPHGLNNPGIVGVLAVSARNVFAIGSGGTQDEGGPVVVLHYKGVK